MLFFFLTIFILLPILIYTVEVTLFPEIEKHMNERLNNERNDEK